MDQIQTKSIEILKTERIIGHISGKEAGPTLVLFGGMHGNEPSGVEALERVFKKFKATNQDLNGAVFGIKGNLPALLEKKRFLEHDLNRIWTRSGIDEIERKSISERSVEENELSEIHQLISDIFATQSPPFYFIDFHTIQPYFAIYHNK